jgi:hypothetical protein
MASGSPPGALLFQGPQLGQLGPLHGDRGGLDSGGLQNCSLLDYLRLGTPISPRRILSMASSHQTAKRTSSQRAKNTASFG